MVRFSSKSIRQRALLSVLMCTASCSTSGPEHATRHTGDPSSCTTYDLAAFSSCDFLSCTDLERYYAFFINDEAGPGGVRECRGPDACGDYWCWVRDANHFLELTLWSSAGELLAANRQYGHEPCTHYGPVENACGFEPPRPQFAFPSDSAKLTYADVLGQKYCSSATPELLSALDAPGSLTTTLCHKSADRWELLTVQEAECLPHLEHPNDVLPTTGCDRP